MKEFFKNKFGLTNEGAKKISMASISGFFSYVGNIIPMIMLMFFLDDILFNHPKSLVFYIILSLLTIVFMYLTLNIDYNSTYNTTYKESANLRIEISNKLSRLPMSFFSNHNLSDLAQTIMSDVSAVEHALSHSIPKIGAMIIFYPFISILLILGNIKLGLLVVVPNILSLCLMLLSKNLQGKYWKKYHNMLRDISEKYQETIELSQELKTFNKYDEVKESLYKLIEEREKIQFKTEAIVGIIMILTGVFGFISIPLVAIVGINLLKVGEINILYFAGYMAASLNLRNVFEGSKELIAEGLFLDPKVKTIKNIRNAKVQKGEDVDMKSFDIKFTDVSFSYKDGSTVIDNLSFTAEQGEVTALVGPSGCGKSTVLKLISRLYDYESGKIQIDGRDIKDISTENLYKNISIVFQDVQLFNNTIMENIRIGRKDATDEEVKEAARRANCEFIERLPEGFNTFIGENGAELSGGERQRLSIARAFLKDAPIVILDEIASSLDVNNEQKIQDSLNKLMKGKTVIIISHRMKSIENTDKIVVIKNGKIDAIGKHSELLKKSPVYKNLINKSKLAEEFNY